MYPVKIMSFLLMGIILSGPALAADNVSAEARVVGPAFKTLAKAYVATANINELKSKNIRRVQSMDQAWFQKRYADVYAVISRMPPHLKTRYGVRENMNQEQAVKIIRTMDKTKLYELIDNIPDVVIMDEFNKQFASDPDKKNVGLMEKVQRTWSDIVSKANEGPVSDKKSVK